MAKAKQVQHKTVRYEPDKVLLMVAVVSVLTLVFLGLITTF